jgi:hypothetical protein
MLYAQTGLDMEAPERTTLDFRTVPHVFGVPRYLYRKAFRTMLAWMRDLVRRRTLEAFEHELWLCFFAGIVRQRFRDSRSRRPVPSVAAGA